MTEWLLNILLRVSRSSRSSARAGYQRARCVMTAFQPKKKSEQAERWSVLGQTKPLATRIRSVGARRADVESREFCRRSFPMLSGVALREILLSREKSGVEFGLGLWHLHESFVFEPFDVGKIAQRREAEDLQLMRRDRRATNCKFRLCAGKRDRPSSFGETPFFYIPAIAGSRLGGPRTLSAEDVYCSVRLGMQITFQQAGSLESPAFGVEPLNPCGPRGRPGCRLLRNG
jgi:hypothetical protein